MMISELVPSGFAAITPSDSTVLGLVGIFVTGTGDVVVTDSKGNDSTFSGFPAKTYLWGRIVKVKAATTATGIIGMLP